MSEGPTARGAATYRGKRYSERRGKPRVAPAVSEAPRASADGDAPQDEPGGAGLPCAPGRVCVRPGSACARRP